MQIKWHQNQRGEIATAAVLATFLVLSIATIAVSVMTQNQDQALTTNTRAAENGCYIGKVCDIPACNEDLGGDPGKCSACNGGWCAGGRCATCGNQGSSGNKNNGGGSNSGSSNCPLGKRADGKCKCRERDNNNAFYCTTGKSRIDTFCDSCHPEYGCAQEVETCYGEPIPAQQNPTAQPAQQNPPAQPQQNPPQQPQTNTSSGGNTNTNTNTDTSTSTGSNTNTNSGTSTTNSGGSNNAGQSSTGTTTTSTPTCKFRVYFKDSQTKANINNVTFTFTPDKGGAESGTGTLTGYYTGGSIEINGSGRVQIKGEHADYTTVNISRQITAPGNNGICEETVEMTKKSTSSGTKTFNCPSGETTSQTCNGRCSSNQECKFSREDLVSGTTCYKCVNKPAEEVENDTLTGTTGDGKSQEEMDDNQGSDDRSDDNKGSEGTTDENKGTQTTETGEIGQRCNAETIPQSSGQQRYTCDSGYCDKSKNPPLCSTFDKNVIIKNVSPVSNFIVESVCFWKGFSLTCEYYDKSDRSIAKSGGTLTYTDLNKLCQKYYPREEGAQVSAEIYYHRDPATASGLNTDTRSMKYSTSCKDFNGDIGFELQ